SASHCNKIFLFDIINKENNWIRDVEEGNKTLAGKIKICIKDAVKYLIGRKNTIQKYREDILISHSEIKDVFAKLSKKYTLNYYGIATRQWGTIDNKKDYRIIYCVTMGDGIK
ncbi:MAG: hypothetical protein K0U12_04730, partial [Gammaproteobacteria bacterium]|nr:hypothetical protein [Gammaproteobacteria bacterium]